jgi:hypothetical protein
VGVAIRTDFPEDTGEHFQSGWLAKDPLEGVISNGPGTSMGVYGDRDLGRARVQRTFLERRLSPTTWRQPGRKPSDGGSPGLRAPSVQSPHAPSSFPSCEEDPGGQRKPVWCVTEANGPHGQRGRVIARTAALRRRATIALAGWARSAWRSSWAC